ncbi:MAG: NADH-quinone oxidoreductase subunit A [Deltaproteobacteria bacterium]|nr:NADH-quinone oxidoreductase subunit A [Deltaproteobacteria bacterium]
MQALGDFRLLGGLLVLGAAIGMLPLLLPRLISPRYHGKQTDETYECGVETIGTAWVRFSMAFYLFALIFVAFEVDILYLFPIALVYDRPEFGLRDLAEVAIFLGILSLAIVYAWRKGVFKWD